MFKEYETKKTIVYTAPKIQRNIETISELILLNKTKIMRDLPGRYSCQTWMCVTGYVKAGFNPKIIEKIFIKNIEPLINFIPGVKNKFR